MTFEEMTDAVHNYEAATETFYDEAEKYATEQLQALSRQLPKRKVRLLSGNGRVSLEIERRRELKYHDAWGTKTQFVYYPGCGRWARWIKGPAFLVQLDELEDQLRLPGLGNVGLVTFLNGVEIPND